MHPDTKRLLIVSAMVLMCFLGLSMFKTCNASKDDVVERAFYKIKYLEHENDSLMALIRSNEEINADVVNAPVLSKNTRDSLFKIWERETGLSRFRKAALLPIAIGKAQVTANGDDRLRVTDNYKDSGLCELALENCEQTNAMLAKDVDELNVVYEKTILIARKLQYKADVQGAVINNDSSIMAIQLQAINKLNTQNAEQARKIKRKNKTIVKLALLSTLEALGIYAILKL